MEILILLVPFSLALGLIFVGGFIWTVKSGQYDDIETPPSRLLFDDTDDLPIDSKTKQSD